MNDVLYQLSQQTNYLIILQQLNSKINKIFVLHFSDMIAVHSYPLVPVFKTRYNKTAQSSMTMHPLSFFHFPVQIVIILLTD